MEALIKGHWGPMLVGSVFTALVLWPGIVAWRKSLAMRSPQADGVALDRVEPFVETVRRDAPVPRLVVTVLFGDVRRGVTMPFSNEEAMRGYTYVWPFPEVPQIGDWAIAEGYDGPTSVVVALIGKHPSNSFPDDQLKSLVRRIPSDEVERLRFEYSKELSRGRQG